MQRCMLGSKLKHSHLIKSREGGKLTKEEIAMLGDKLVEGVVDKMSLPTANLLAAAAVDLTALIKTTDESWVAKIK